MAVFICWSSEINDRRNIGKDEQHDNKLTQTAGESGAAGKHRCLQSHKEMREAKLNIQHADPIKAKQEVMQPRHTHRLDTTKHTHEMRDKTTGRTGTEMPGRQGPGRKRQKQNGKYHRNENKSTKI